LKFNPLVHWHGVAPRLLLWVGRGNQLEQEEGTDVPAKWFDREAYLLKYAPKQGYMLEISHVEKTLRESRSRPVRPKVKSETTRSLTSLCWQGQPPGRAASSNQAPTGRSITRTDVAKTNFEARAGESYLAGAEGRTGTRIVGASGATVVIAQKEEVKHAR
jgi:hypothetical protein